MTKRTVSYLYGALCGLMVLSSVPSFAQDAAAGETLFTNNCASCHGVTKEKVYGPGLGGIEERRNEEWIIKWVKNPAGMIASGDAYSVKLYEQYKPTVMQGFALSDDQIKNILAYVKEAGKKAEATAAGGGAGGAANGGGEGGGGDSGYMSTLLIGLMVLMAILLGAVLTMLTALSKKTGISIASKSEGSFFSGFKTAADGMVANPAFRSGAFLLFALFAGKSTIDGMYGIGVHQGYAPKQPIAFSHKLHAGQYQIDCNYCHTGVNKGKQANVPAANICMNCHNAIKGSSPEIQKIYRAIEKDQPIEWVRVHNLPDLAYFNHAQHVNVGGVQCAQCHGEVEKMEVIEQRSSLTMGWCIDCHRKTSVNAKDNKYYDKLVEIHKEASTKDMKVADIGGLECSKCHY